MNGWYAGVYGHPKSIRKIVFVSENPKKHPIVPVRSFQAAKKIKIGPKEWLMYDESCVFENPSWLVGGDDSIPVQSRWDRMANHAWEECDGDWTRTLAHCVFVVFVVEFAKKHSRDTHPYETMTLMVGEFIESIRSPKSTSRE